MLPFTNPNCGLRKGLTTYINSFKRVNNLNNSLKIIKTKHTLVITFYVKKREKKNNAVQTTIHEKHPNSFLTK